MKNLIKIFERKMLPGENDDIERLRRDAEEYIAMQDRRYDTMLQRKNKESEDIEKDYGTVIKQLSSFADAREENNKVPSSTFGTLDPVIDAMNTSGSIGAEVGKPSSQTGSVPSSQELQAAENTPDADAGFLRRYSARVQAAKDRAKKIRISERKMLPGEKSEEKKLHKKISKAPFIKQYGKDRGEEIYYGYTKKLAMEDRCPCEDEVILEKEGKKKRGSPWFIDKETRNKNPHSERKRIPRNHPNRSYLTKAQMATKRKLGQKLIKSYKKRGFSLSDPSPGDPAKTVEEMIWATATKLTLDGVSSVRSKKKKDKSKATQKREARLAKSKSDKEARQKSIRSALSKIDRQRSEKQ
jgi:hypothetical protein